MDGAFQDRDHSHLCGRSRRRRTGYCRSYVVKIRISKYLGASTETLGDFEIQVSQGNK
jgi:hypothetical protein